MKHSIPLTVAGALFGGMLAIASDVEAQVGGFAGPDNLKLVTVAEALQLPDDADVKLQGYIVKSVGDENYEFRDDSGTIVVEIDDDDWGGLEVTPDIWVEISGEIEQERNGAELEVDSIRQL
ncbi:MAG TPA: NirD/YgiW/YdeI family stress tolerance protein [Woeseiaceae bacterium]|nr:NirD/YgiW/YdeI family stress tolerance protein [Woeseiaceae bacterium]